MKEPRNEREATTRFGGCGCSLGRTVCNCFVACEMPEPESSARSWLYSDLAVIGIACLVVVGFICGVFT